MLNQPTIERLRQMRLSGMAEAFAAQLKDQDIRSLSFEERFGLIVDQEWTCRQDHRLKRLLRGAKLRLPACVEDIDYQQPRGLDRSVLHALAGAGYLRGHQNVLVEGPTGVGKTFTACALANAACRQGFSARYYRLPRLISELTTARGDGSYPRLLSSLLRVDLLVLDDWGLATLGPGDGRELLEVIEDRSQTKSTLIASQLPVDDWHAAIGDPTVADAILDRLVHNAHRITMKGESMRKVKRSQDQTEVS